MVGTQMHTQNKQRTKFSFVFISVKIINHTLIHIPNPTVPELYEFTLDGESLHLQEYIRLPLQKGKNRSVGPVLI